MTDRAKAVARSKAYNERHPERRAATNRAYYQRNKEKKAAFQRAWAVRNREKVSAYMRKYRAADPEKYAARARAFYAKNPAKCSGYSKAYQKRNRAKVAAAGAAYRKAHTEKRREFEARRRARLRGATIIPFTTEQLEQRLSMFGHRCWICGAHGDEVDHVKPLARGGAHILANLRPACGTCNRRKNATWPLMAAKE